MKSIPDFVVLNADGNNFFLEVKFRSYPDRFHEEKSLKQLAQHWQPKLILVTIAKPYFRVADPESLTEHHCAFKPLETDPDFHVTRAALEAFEPMVDRFLINGKASVNSHFPLRIVEKQKST